MTHSDIQTIDELVPHVVSQLILKEAMEKVFPDEREEIEHHLCAFGAAWIRYSRKEPDTKALQQYFRKTCGWNEFQAIWYRARIEEFFVMARANRRQENLRE